MANGTSKHTRTKPGFVNSDTPKQPAPTASPRIKRDPASGNGK